MSDTNLSPEDKDPNEISIDYADDGELPSTSFASDDGARAAAVTSSLANESATDKEIARINVRMKEIEEEAEKLRVLSESSAFCIPAISSSIASNIRTEIGKTEADRRSVYVGNVDYDATTQDLRYHFQHCGQLSRVTILCNSNGPKGYAFMEFEDIDSVSSALLLDNTLLLGRAIKVMQKRTNHPGFSKYEQNHPFGHSGRGKRNDRYSPYLH